MDSIIVAFATDDGKTFMDRHFGEADFYDIYEVLEDGANFVKRIDNTADEEEGVHASPEKAKGVAHLLKRENVRVAVSKFFGPNIERIKRKFVCVLMDDASLDEAMKKFRKNLELIYDEWAKGEEREYISLKNK